MMRAHSHAPEKRRSSQAGFTLVELMVSLAIFAVVAVAVTMVLMTSAKNKQETAANVEAQQTARAAMDLMARDIRSAGYGTDQDYGTPQPAIAYVDSAQIILSQNQLPYPDNGTGPLAPLAYNPTSDPKPFPLNGTSYAPPIRYRTGAELVRYTLDANNDGAINATDVTDAAGADAASTPNPNDMVLLRQVYGDSTGGVAGSNGGTTERVALVRTPGPGVAPIFTVHMKGSSTPWNWANGPVPAGQLEDIARVVMNVTATSSRPDAKGQYVETTLRSEVSASRSVPNFGAKTFVVSGYVYEDKNTNRVMDGSDTGVSGATVRLGPQTAYTAANGFYQFRAAAGTYTLKHTPAAGYGSYSSPDSFSITISTAAVSQSFADTLRSGGWVTARAFEDIDSDGSQGVTEPALSAISFSATGSNGMTATGTTDAYGAVSLFVSSGAYALGATPPDSLAATTANPVSGSISNGGTGSHTFGFKKQSTGRIQGRVYSDANRNGALDGSESGIADVWVGVSDDGGVTVLGYANTDASGDYSISVPINSPPTTKPYTVYSVPPGGYFPTGSTAISGLYVTNGGTLTGKNFGMANYQIITLNASRVLSLVAADLVENDWQANKTNLARADKDLILGADAGGTDNVSVWFNKYASSPLFGANPINPDGYTRLAPNSVMAMAVDTLDMNDDKARPDLVTGTKYAAAGNFFVWFTQGSKSNEGFLPTTYSTSRNYKTTDNGDVQAVVTMDCGGGTRPDIIVGTKSATAGQGSIEVWLSNDATTPAFTQNERFTTINGGTMGEVTGLALADMDSDGDKDLVVVTRTSDYNGQLCVYENYGRTAGGRFREKYTRSFSGDAMTCVSLADGDGDGRMDIFLGTQRGVATGRIFQYRNTGSFGFSVSGLINAPGIVQSITAADLGGTSTRTDVAVGYRTSSTGFGGGVRVYYLDTGTINGAGTDPSGGSVVNMVPALTWANFNYGLNSTAPPSPYLSDLAAGMKS
ncbi:MAG: FG-GAP-like repeat-containing protein, partial [Candidatus Eisenbacteria bacterium]|nr:FG-GAP-like repeat-containing protein [Candidatus Eisenbacteria bacterium]